MDAALQLSLRAAVEYRVLEVGAEDALRGALDAIVRLREPPASQDKATERQRGKARGGRSVAWVQRPLERAEEGERPPPLATTDWAPQKADKGRRWADLHDDDSEGAE
jgi:hypothetical protein